MFVGLFIQNVLKTPKSVFPAVSYYLCMCACLWSQFSHVWLFAIPWTVAHQAPPSMELSRQENWSGLPCPSPETNYSSKRHGNNLNSTDRWMHIEEVVHIYNGILLSHRKEGNAICSNMDGPRDCHTKWNKSEKEKYYMISLMCGI